MNRHVAGIVGVGFFPPILSSKRISATLNPAKDDCCALALRTKNIVATEATQTLMAVIAKNGRRNSDRRIFIMARLREKAHRQQGQRSRRYHSLKSPLCSCVSITLPASFAIWPRPFVEDGAHPLAVEPQTKSIFLRKLGDFCLSVFLVQKCSPGSAPPNLPTQAYRLKDSRPGSAPQAPDPILLSR
jgi:hypothetical protein